LIAYLNRNDRHHDWAVALMRQVRPPMLTCEAVLTEAASFLREDGLSVARLRALMARYSQMDLADACVVAMTELHRRCQVLTVDREEVIDLIAPPR
jgi:predicted nucleic acid-binding protein